EQLKLGNTRFYLKDYQIIDSIGQGGMGRVFKAEHSIMGRVVAIKVLPKERSSKEAIASFHHEIRVLAKLDHPNLVRAFDAGHDGNVHFLVTELVPGSDLRQLIRGGRKLNERDAATIIAKAALGLQHAHQRGLIHRDIKPGNIMVTPDGDVKVLDLGLAGFLQSDVENVDPRKGRIVGTADYLAPEVIMSPDSATPTSDIYSLGCSLYYAITSKVPFPGGSSGQKCQRHLNEIPLHPNRFNRELNQNFLDVLAEMMEKDPGKRVKTAAEAIERLAPWTDETVSAGRAQSKSFSDGDFARVLPTPPPLPGELSTDTHEFPRMGDVEPVSSCQISQGTGGVVQANQETLPIIRPDSGTVNRPPAKVGLVGWLMIIGLPILFIMAAVIMVRLLLY
ncbi:MAG: serine/threonine protein kinase, partial [Planctomycetales bacterium]